MTETWIIAKHSQFFGLTLVPATLLIRYHLQLMRKPVQMGDNHMDQNLFRNEADYELPSKKC